MNASEESAVVSAPTRDHAWSGFWSRLDRWAEHLGDRLNPILVKEARQALKSRQFLITFSLMLLCAWGWSLISIGYVLDATARNVTPVIFMGYFVILTLPVMILVPLAAFQSLVMERNEGTFELLWISMLSAQAIVRGKFASAVLQTIIYFSAIVPCLAFTYLLRGMDIVTIATVVGYTFLFSAALTSLSLLLATLTRITQVNVLISGVLVMGLAVGAMVWMSFVGEVFLDQEIPLDDPAVWMGNACIVSVIVSFMVLFLAAAAAQMSFAADNHSTRLRVIMLGQQTLFIGWICFPWEVPRIDAFFPWWAVYWAIMGALMAGERGRLSQRARRALPKTAAGRMFLTWFNPGSGTGYVFAVTNLVVSLLFLQADAWLRRTNLPSLDWNVSWSLVALLCGYVAFYLGLGRLCIAMLRRRAAFGPLAACLIQSIVATFSVLIPFTVQAAMDRVYADRYTLLQMPNWMWSLFEASRNGWTYGAGFTTPLNVTLVVVPLAGLAMFLVNLAAAANEVEQTRIATPKRVIEDDSRRVAKEVS